jgi:hypothetical protein
MMLPASVPEFPQGVEGEQAGSDDGAESRAGSAERWNRPEAADQNHIQHQVENGERYAQDHRRAGITGGAECPAKHEEDQHAAAEEEHDPKEGEGLLLHRRRCIDQIQQPGGSEVPHRSHDRERKEYRGDKPLVDHPVDLVRIARAAEASHQHAHPGEQ